MFVVLGVVSGLTIVCQVCTPNYYNIFGINNKLKVMFTDVATNIRFGETNDASPSHGIHQYTQAIGRLV